MKYRALKEFTITPRIVPSDATPAWGWINPSTVITVAEGTNQSITFGANDPFDVGDYTITPSILSVTDNGTSVSTTSPYQITFIESDHIIEVTFDTTMVGIRYVEIPELGVYPNPTSGKVSVVSGDVEITMIEVTDLLGNVIMVIENSVDELDLSALSKGTYFLRFTTVRGSTIRQIIRN